MSELLVFVCQFAVVYLLGIQSLMVRDSNCLGAAIGAVMIGISQFFIFSIIGGMGEHDVNTLKWWCFILAGPCAIVISIKTHPYISKLFLPKGY